MRGLNRVASVRALSPMDIQAGPATASGISTNICRMLLPSYGSLPPSARPAALAWRISDKKVQTQTNDLQFRKVVVKPIN